MRVLVTLFVVAACLLVSVSGARLRGAFDSPMQAESQQTQQEGELVSFLQQHQQDFARASAAEQDPSAQAQQAAQPTVPQGASEASGNSVLSAVEHSSMPSLVQASSRVHAKEGEDFGPCKTCVFVLERIKKGSNMLLPAICSELYHKYPDAYALCHQVLNALSINGNNVRYWLFEGCFKYEIYQSKEWIKPCPSHVMCSVLKDLAAAPFCPALPMENPFAE